MVFSGIGGINACEALREKPGGASVFPGGLQMGQVPELGDAEGGLAPDPLFRDHFGNGRGHAEHPVPENHGGNIRQIAEDGHGNPEVAKEGEG